MKAKVEVQMMRQVLFVAGILLPFFIYSNCLRELSHYSNFRGEVFEHSLDGKNVSYALLDEDGTFRFEYRGALPERPGNSVAELASLISSGLQHFESKGLKVRVVEVEWLPDEDAFSAHEFRDFLERARNLGDASSAMQTTTGKTLVALGFADVYRPEYFYDRSELSLPIHRRTPQLVRVRFWP